jgi:hypothetical protein
MRQLEGTDALMDPTIRLRIATRIHFALLRHYGEDVGVSTLLNGEAGAREALWVCQASGHKELVSLAKQFDTATRQETRAVGLRSQQARIEASTAALRGATPQDMAWSRDTSGFGLTRAPEAFDAPVSKSGGWLKTPSWLRLGATTA